MMLLASILGLVLGSSQPGPGLSAAADGGTVLSSAGAAVTYPMTNGHVIFSSNASATITLGQEYLIYGSSNAISLDNFTPDVAQVIGNRTAWITSGVVRMRATFAVANGTTAASLAFPVGSALSGLSYYLSFSNYTGGSLADHALTNITARTNDERTGNLFSGMSANGWTWNTNSLIYGLTGYTGLSLPTNSWAFTAITPRHAVTAGHITAGAVTNASYVGRALTFIGTDGTTNLATVAATRRRYSDIGYPFDDYTLVIFSNDLPAVVQPLKVTWRTNIDNRLPQVVGGIVPPRPMLETCQHGRVGSQTMPIFDSHAMHIGGDSGNPAFIIVSNSLVTYGGTSGTLLSSNFLYDLNALTAGADLSTNNYQPTIWSLEEYPTP